MNLRPLLLVLLTLALSAAVTREASVSAVEKLDRIGSEELESGETVVLTEDELNAYLRYDGAQGVPDGINDVEVTLRRGGGIVESVVDLDEAGASSGDAPFFMRLLMRGTRSVTADVDYEAHNGYATAKIVSVTIDGFELSGAALEWFLSAFAPEELQPYVSGRPVALESRLSEIQIEPGRAVMTAE